MLGMGSSHTDSPSNSRREFLASLAAVSAAGLAPKVAWAASAVPSTVSNGGTRGLVSAPDDFAFAPGLIYLQTGSLGPTPRPVMERTIAAWKELELNPVMYGYGDHEH